jgi:uncharacterized protein (DUF58 family)
MRVTLPIQRDTARAAARETTGAIDPRVYTTLDHLVRLQHRAAGFSLLPRQPVHSVLAGRHASRLRGRGLNFEETRAYQTGDDVRLIDWKVTARMRVPYVRVFREERNRPLLLVVDQRLAMFFGTRVRMKSVTAAEAAALGAWRALAVGDRVGGIVFNDTDLVEVRPLRSRATVLRILTAIAAQNAALRADAPTPSAPGMLNRALEAAARLADHDHTITVVSDFDGAADETRRRLVGLARHNDVLCVLVHDPSATALPPRSTLVVSDGVLQVELLLGMEHVHREVAAFSAGRIADILRWPQTIGIPVLPLDTADPVAEQVRRFLGQHAPVGGGTTVPGAP